MNQAEEIYKQQLERAQSFPRGKDIIPEDMKEAFPEFFLENED